MRSFSIMIINWYGLNNNVESNFFAIILLINLCTLFQGMNPISVIGFVCYIIASLTTIGMLFDNKQNAYIFEVLRCVVFVVTLQFLTLPGINATITFGITIFFSLSGVFWFMRAKNLIEIR